MIQLSPRAFANSVSHKFIDHPKQLGKMQEAASSGSSLINFIFQNVIHKWHQKAKHSNFFNVRKSNTLQARTPLNLTASLRAQCVAHKYYEEEQTESFLQIHFSLFLPSPLVNFVRP